MLEARSLTKYYDHTPAVRDVSFTIRPGEILGYLGSNGAGKSTTVKMLIGLIEPSDGSIFYQGRSVHDNFTEFQRRIGYVPDEAYLYPHLSGWEYLQLVGRLRGISREVLEPKIDEFLRAFSVWDARHDLISSYSKGMRQKVLLSAALLHNPDVLVLDEPFSGLDVSTALVLRSFLRKLASQGKMILFSSHVLEVVEKVCTKVLILSKGKVVAYDSVDRLQELMSQPSLEGVFAQLSEAQDSDALADQILNVMALGEPGQPPSEVACSSGVLGLPPPVRSLAIGLRLYRALVGAFPREFQNAYGEELLEVTDLSIDQIWRRHGLIGLARLLLDIAIRVPIEYFSEFRQDVRYGLRMLLASPGFTAVALLSLSLGICIATCAFSEMNGMVLRNLPVVSKPSELVALEWPATYPDYKRYRERSDLFISTAAYIAPAPFTVSFGGVKERTWGHLVSPSYFSTLGVHPALGRLFGQEEEKPGLAAEAVVSHRFWENHLGADPSIIGKTLQVNGNPCTVIGVGPKDFLGASPALYVADLWMPVSVGGQVAPELGNNALERRDMSLFHVVGRLNPRVTSERAEAELDAVARQAEQDTGAAPSPDKSRRVTLAEGGKLLPLRKQDLPFFTSFFLIMAGLVMLIACANVANMMLARAIRRRKEIAVRLALGAGRGRLIRQMVTESMLIAAGAGVLGFMMSAWLMYLMSQLRMPFPMPVSYDLRPDWRALVFTFGLAALVGLVFGLTPALQSTRGNLTPALQEGGAVLLPKFRRLTLRNLLMVAQVAGSLTLLVILGLLSLGIQSTLGIQQGFNSNGLYLVSLDPIRDGYSGPQAAAFLHKLLDRVKTLPSVTSASLTETVPVSLGNTAVRFSTSNSGGQDSQVLHDALKYLVGKDYFDTTGIAILQGRGFRAEDEGNSSSTVIVSEELVRKYWQGEDPLGRRIEIGNGGVFPAKIMPGSTDYRPAVSKNGPQRFEVVGVAKDVANNLLMNKKQPAIYFPLRPADFATPSLQGETLMVRAAPGANALEAVRRELSTLDRNVMPFNARSMNEQIAQFMSPLRSAAWTYGLIGIFGLLLAAVGLAGMTAYSVAQRGREIGIRMALGASKGDVLRLIMKEGMLLISVGTAIGLACAWAGSRMLSAMNSSVGQVTATSASDPVVLFGAPLLLASLTLLACYFPARESIHIDPVVTLRQQ